MSLKQREIKFKPGIKLNHNIYKLQIFKELEVSDNPWLLTSTTATIDFYAIKSYTPIVGQFKRRTGYVRTSSRRRNWFDLVLETMSGNKTVGRKKNGVPQSTDNIACKQRACEQATDNT